MSYGRWFKDLSRVDFLTSVGLYVAPEALYLVRLRKSIRHLSVLEDSPGAHAAFWNRADRLISSVTGA